jgi:hypothetical protein
MHSRTLQEPKPSLLSFPRKIPRKVLAGDRTREEAGDPMTRERILSVPACLTGTRVMKGTPRDPENSASQAHFPSGQAQGGKEVQAHDAATDEIKRSSMARRAPASIDSLGGVASIIRLPLPG